MGPKRRNNFGNPSQAFASVMVWVKSLNGCIVKTFDPAVLSSSFFIFMLATPSHIFYSDVSLQCAPCVPWRQNFYQMLLRPLQQPSLYSLH